MAEITKIVEGRREFKDPVSGKSYFVAPPTADDIRGADWQYSKTYTKCLIEGITTAAEMMDILLRRGVVGTEFEQRQKELTDYLSKKVEELRFAESIDQKQESAMAVANARSELFSWNQRLNGPMANTCEQMADDARLEFLTASIIQDTEGKRVWDAYSDFLTEKNQRLTMRARFEVMLFLQGLESDFLERTPEAMAIKEVEAEIQKRATDILDNIKKETDQKTLETEALAVSEPASEATPKKRRSKKAAE